MVNDLDLISFLLNVTKELRLGITMILMVLVDEIKIDQDLVVTLLLLKNQILTLK